MKLLLFLMFAMTSVFSQPKEEVPLIPMKDFFRNPEKRSYSISPDGEYLSWMQPWESRMNVFVQKIGEDEVTQVTFAKERSEEHTSELQSRENLVCRLLLEKK